MTDSSEGKSFIARIILEIVSHIGYHPKQPSAETPGAVEDFPPRDPLCIFLSSLHQRAQKTVQLNMLRDRFWLSAKSDCKVGFILLLTFCDSEAAERRNDWFH